jgi:hypothetical protein
MLREIQRYIWIGVAIAMLYVGSVFVGRRAAPAGKATAARDPEWERHYGGESVRILQFYAREGSVSQGEKGLLCYGVVHAKSVRMEPPVDGVMPALNKCVEVAARRDTRYTLTAEGSDGTTVSESFVLGVTEDPSTIPKITTFRVANREVDYAGDLVFSIEYGQQNGVEVLIEPSNFGPIHGAPSGRFYAKPGKTTTYTMTVTGRFGHRTRKSIVLEVPAAGGPQGQAD